VIESPKHIEPEHLNLEAHGAIIGPGLMTAIDRIIYVVPSQYGQMPEQERYSIARLIGRLTHVNGDGEITFITDPGSPMYYRNMGLSTNPQIMCDEDGVLYLAYSSTTETFDNTIYNYKHIWMRASPDGGTTWGDITPPEPFNAGSSWFYPVVHFSD